MGKKQLHKSKEEILADMKNNKQFQERLTFTRDVFYPALCKSSKNIDDAMFFLTSINTMMMEIFLGMMKERNLGELNLMSKLDPAGEKYEELKAMVALFEDKTIFEAKSYFEGMKGEIQMWINDETKERSLESLKTKWIDQI